MRFAAKSALLLTIAVILNSQIACALRYTVSYEEAVDTAQRTGKPICILFQVSWGPWSNKFDRETFSNSAVSDLTKKFVFVKLNGDRHALLRGKYSVHRYPHIVFVNKNEEVLGRIAGFVGPVEFKKHALAAYRLAGPIIGTQLKERIEFAMKKGRKALEEGSYGSAIGYFSTVAKLDTQDPLIDEARKKLKEIDKEGAKQIRAALSAAEEENYVDAMAQLKAIAQNFEGSPVQDRAKEEFAKLVADPAVAKLQRENEASQLLSSAKTDYEEKQYGNALGRLDFISKKYADTEAGKEAESIAATIKANKDIMRQISDEQATTMCRSWLSLARSYEKNKLYKQAIEYYDKVIAEFPDSSYADTARGCKAEIEKLL